jgi:membrane protease YdiL (CAAX protease family)
MAAPSDVAPHDDPAQRDPAERMLGWTGIGVAAFAFLIGLFAASLIGVVWVASRSLDPAEAQDELGFSVATSAGLWVGFVVLPLLWSRRHGGPAQLLGLRARWVDLPLGLAVGLGSTALAALASSLVLDVGQQDDLESKARTTVDRASGPAAAVVLVIVLCVLTPLAEEIFFRGLLFRSLHRVTGLAVSVLGAGAVFGLVHFDPAPVPAVVVAMQLGLLAMFGAALCLLVHRTGRLAASIVAHAAFNSVTVVTLLLQ